MKTSAMTKGEIAGCVLIGFLFAATVAIGWGTVWVTWGFPRTGACDLVSCR